MKSTRQALFAKIKALLAKTVENGCTEDEMAAAMAKAAEMMAAHDVNETDLSFSDDPVRRETMPRETIREQLFHAVGAFCECQAWIDPGNIVFFGCDSDVILAHWLVDMLADFTQRNALAHLVESRPRDLAGKRQAHRSFVGGCTMRLNARLYEMASQRRLTTGGTGSCLVPAKRALIAAEMAREGITLRDASARLRRVQADAYAAGKAAGDRANFSTPVGRTGAPLSIGQA